MKKGKHEFYILLKDAEGSRFAVTGPMQTHLLKDWYVAAEVGDVLALDVRPEDLQAQRSFLLENGWQEVDPADLVDEPIDRSNHYVGRLPSYASDADRSRLVSILCRDCRKIRWAALNRPFPGFERLKAAGMSEYRAACLKCGYSAMDNYNWSRP
ncbi:Unknown protein sequence [Pseudomonas amygdali pv. eriobotryae]|uniref:Uncharacterized protein n=1 Tax=Pseudomonas amygdali pv. eriobotryae TaxID=129137 RepID=A0A0N8REW1_PSEA0|nr:hypothetical protein [Pseudomonas amygdali]KPX21495.1 Unknown protein sequence [Pseudomonas amygdali pv. eriobotryae]KWS75498.1 hypothetical protein AL052_08635 [Pseudomonas amygdali pv. eriobotryae]RMM01116.1 hypothetical protein ALQ86_01388 [Pseudomonas amygdali pv. eriobotryae]RMO64406.1 hypothetical protein ALQ39_04063 [Pseudomonas amygdali pv. eriobotryae]GFZ73582.1 hypothetical protein PSE10C_43240 [Pseudomonas amygdali pv. eriobotryae]